MDVRQAARVLRAAGKRRLELASKILRVRVSQQEIRHRLRIRRNIEWLVVANARQWARRQVAHRVAARFLCRNPHRRQPPHQIWRVLDVDEVQLEILPRRHVQNSVRILIRHFCQRFHLRRRQPAKRHFDPLHPRRVPVGIRSLRQVARWVAESLRLRPVEPLSVVVPLPVNPPAQARFCKDFFINFILLPQLNLPLENLDLAGALIRHVGFYRFFPVLVTHTAFSSLHFRRALA